MPDSLVHLARLAREAGATAVAGEAEALAARVVEGRFHVACVGQFKRGKSTLINALLGAPILPAGVLPVTSVVTVVRHAESSSARVRLADGWAAIDPANLADYVSEERNPGNHIGVAALEVYAPSPLLAAGLCLVDTPGLGSVFAANAAATREFVPQIDAAIAVLGADPPISGDELDLLVEIAHQDVPLLLVLNKADRLSDDERSQAVGFTREVVSRRLGRAAGPVHQVSAAERLQGVGPARDWGGLAGELSSLCAASGRGLVQRAEERGLALLASRLTNELDERRLALLRPLAESAARLGRLRSTIAAAERSLADLGPLLAAEQERLRRRFGEERDRFLAAALPEAAAELEAGRASAARAREIARRRLEEWRAAQQPEAERLYRALAARFVALANDHLANLRRLPGLAGLPLELAPEAGFRVASRFFFNEMLPVAEPSLAHTLLGAASIGRHAQGYLERLLMTNSARVVNDFQERVLDSRRQLESELKTQLSELTTAAERALEEATAIQAQGTAGVQAEALRLERLRNEVGDLVLHRCRAPSAT